MKRSFLRRVIRGLLGSIQIGMFALVACQGATGTATLSWSAPTTNADLSALSDLAGYKVYYGLASGQYTDKIDVGIATTFTVTMLQPARIYFAVKAYDTSFNESAFSNEVFKDIQ